MVFSPPLRIASLLLFAAAMTPARETPAAASPERARANFARLIFR